MAGKDPSKKMGRWYFGGLASAGAACCTHPLDLLKVHLQTAGKSENIGVVKQTAGIIRNQGVLALYNGLSASLVRQLTYSTTRFAIYEVQKKYCCLWTKNKFRTLFLSAGGEAARVAKR